MKHTFVHTICSRTVVSGGNSSSVAISNNYSGDADSLVGIYIPHPTPLERNCDWYPLFLSFLSTYSRCH